MTELFNISKFLSRRRELRKLSTPQEKILWNELRNNKFGIKFRRQYSVGGYILDFCCANKKLGVEIDGPIHEQKAQKEYDSVRDILTTELGYTMIRFSNKDIENNLGEVVEKIRLILDSIVGHPSSLGRRGAGER